MTSSQACGFPTETDVLAALNRHCRCAVVDDSALTHELEAQLSDPGLYRAIRDSHPHLFSATAVFVAHADIERMRALIGAIEQAVAAPAFRRRALTWADSIAAVEPGSPGAFLGYDFHLGADGGPKLIEINTNAGGALLNAALARAARACCAETERMAIGAPDARRLEESFIQMFRNEWRAHGRTGEPGTIAVVDDDPAAQYLYPEFRMFATLFERAGWRAIIADAATLQLRGTRLYSGDTPIDLVYNRLTDFAFTEPRHIALRNAYINHLAVVTPHPRAYALYADKRNLTLLTDPDVLASLALPAETVKTLLNDIPHTRLVTPADAESFWAQRKRWFFKPVMGFGSRAAYRGDKLTRRVFEEIAKGGYVAQARVEPSERAHLHADAPPLKFDLRCYVYDGEIQLLAARLYQGQTTNFRTPGGGFAPVFYLDR